MTYVVLIIIFINSNTISFNLIINEYYVKILRPKLRIISILSIHLDDEVINNNKFKLNSKHGYQRTK